MCFQLRFIVWQLTASEYREQVLLSWFYSVTDCRRVIGNMPEALLLFSTPVIVLFLALVKLDC